MGAIGNLSSLLARDIAVKGADAEIHTITFCKMEE